MDLQLLNGFDDSSGFSGDDMGELGKINFKSVLNKLNKLNPATILLRNGLLVSMKLNIGGVAKQLRWSYLTPQQAAAKKMNMDNFNKLVKVRKKLETIFFGAGGNLKNLKKAILNGKGNKDKQVVAGLGDIDLDGIEYMGINTPLQQLLGDEMYYSENERTFKGFKGFGELGEPATIASLAAASGVVVSIVTMLKKIGGLFGGKGPSSGTDAASTDDASPAAASDGRGAPSPDESSAASTVTSAGSAKGSSSISSGSSGEGPASGDDGNTSTASSASNGDGEALTPGPSLTTPVVSAAKAEADPTDTTPVPAKAGFWEKNKKWLKPVAIGAGGLTVIAIGYHFLKPHPHLPRPPLSGPPGSKRHPRKKKKKYSSKKTAVALL